MPQDVPLGQGYLGDALLHAFPGQYRGEAPAQTNPATYLPQPPGAASGRPSYTDPDQGRQLALVEMPGVGQVVVPVEHTMVGMNQVVPVDYTMIGVDHAPGEDLSGMDALAANKWTGQKIGQVAGRAVKEAVAALKQGVAPARVQAMLQAYIDKAAEQIEARLRRRIAQIPAIKKQAFAEAWKQILAISGAGMKPMPLRRFL